MTRMCCIVVGRRAREVRVFVDKEDQRHITQLPCQATRLEVIEKRLPRTIT